MTARLKKEFRVLLPSWSVAMVAAVMFPVLLTFAGRLHRQHIGGLPLEWLQALAGITIFVGGLAMAAMSFGVEIQHCTLGLLLVQPMERSRIWWSKMLPLGCAFISVGLAYLVGLCLADATRGNTLKLWDSGGTVVASAFLFGALCSSAFWTLQSRSIIGGMVLPLAAQALLAFAITYFASGRTMEVPEELEPKISLALGIGAIVYCVLFAYLGWWKFSRLEWCEGIVGESSSTALPIRRRVRDAQATAPSGPWASLLRKELRLHRPVIRLAALFVVCWIAALGLRALRPAWEIQFEGVLGTIMVIYLPLAWLLSGCISLGEEKQLGTWGWHLTLPVSRLRQWAVKVSFALLVLLAVGILLPALAGLVASGFKMERPDHWLTNASSVLLVAGYATVLSFWAVTMLGNVVRAVLFSLLGAGVLFFGGTMMLGLGQEHRLLQSFCHWLVVEFQFLPYDFQLNRIIAASAFMGLTLLLILLLRQSYVHCRREPSMGVIIKCSISLIVSLFLPLWLGADITSSFRSPAVNELAENLGEAVSKLPSAMNETAIGKSTPVSLEEIDKTGFLNADTKRWLRGTSIQIGQPVAANSGRGRPFVQVGVRFPSGRYFETATSLVRGTPLDH